MAVTKKRTARSHQRHSPGPWRNDYSPETGFGCGYGKSQIIDAEGKPIAGVAAVEPTRGEMYRDGGLSEETFETLEANARLIAAAPTLLEVVRDALKISNATLRGTLSPGDRVREKNWNDELRAAIARAVE